MRHVLLASLLLVTACSASFTAPASLSPTAATGSANPTVAAIDTPAPSLPFLRPTPTPGPEGLREPAVTVTQGSFGILTSLMLKPGALDAELVRAASAGV